MKRFALLAGCLTLYASVPVAADTESEIAALREQVRLLTERLDALERESRGPGHAPQAMAAEVATAAGDQAGQRIEEIVEAEVAERMAAVSWAERISWSGDFRYRYENIEQQGRDDRNRNRIRARAALDARVSDTVHVGLGVASGSEDPVSTNQTLGGGGSHKPISIDLAYFDWSGLANTTISGGKYRNPLEDAGGSQLIWDSDWRPEGLAVTTGLGSFFAHGLGTWIESDSARAQQEFAYGVQAGVRLSPARDIQLMAGAGYYEIEADGKSSFFGDGDFFGNSFDAATGTYLYDYRDVQVFAELTAEIAGLPLQMFADWVTNVDVDEEDTGYTFGFQVGDARQRGDWEFRYAWKRIEADAVLGLLTESDFGAGGTDAKGSVFRGAYAFDDSWFFQASYYVNETGISTGDPEDFDRLQIDLNFKYK